jgi:hypothetical protein
VLAVAVLLSGCGSESVDGTPEGAVRAFLDAMEGAALQGEDAARAFSLLGPSARANLEERARRVALLAGRKMDPVRTLAFSQYEPRFRVRRLSVRRAGGDAFVTVVGDEAHGEVTTLRCVRSQGPGGDGWRVEVDLPPLAPLPKRSNP